MSRSSNNMPPIRISIGDLEKTITVKQLIEEVLGKETVDDIIDKIIQPNLEHWTDDEGLHQGPFEKDVRTELNEYFDEILREVL